MLQKKYTESYDVCKHYQNLKLHKIIRLVKKNLTKEINMHLIIDIYPRKGTYKNRKALNGRIERLSWQEVAK